MHTCMNMHAFALDTHAHMYEHACIRIIRRTLTVVHTTQNITHKRVIRQSPINSHEQGSNVELETGARTRPPKFHYISVRSPYLGIFWSAARPITH